ncbi:MAG: hypothetical protein MJ252_29170 [archaeon]|nr:hypothetical protein [archaeon]
MEQSKSAEPTFVLLSLESIKYILEKNIEPKQQKAEIIELGIHLGDKVSNHLMNTQKLGQSGSGMSQINTIFNFLKDDIWSYIFDRKAVLRKDKISYVLETSNIKFHSYLITDKSSSNDDKLDPILWFVEGIIRGVIGSFNLNCDVSSSFRRGNGFDGNSNTSGYNTFDIEYIYTFEITLIDI